MWEILAIYHYLIANSDSHSSAIYLQWPVCFSIFANTYQVSLESIRSRDLSGAMYESRLTGELSWRLGKPCTLSTGKTGENGWRGNFDSAKEIWLVYPNKASGEPRIGYNEAVEEALCFGWIDSIVKSIDERRAAQRLHSKKSEERLLAAQQRAAEVARG